MGDADRGPRARRAGRSIGVGVATAGRVGAAAASGAGRVVHRLSGASGAGRTGLSNLIELTAAGSVGDAFVAVALAGTLFFSASVDQARGRVALALLITMAPFAVLAPFIGPMLDRVQQGRRYILMRHAAGPRPAVLGHGRRRAAQRRAHAAAGRVRRAGAAEGVRRDPQPRSRRGCCPARSRW